jgi:hypothetical protein
MKSSRFCFKSWPVALIIGFILIMSDKIYSQNSHRRETTKPATFQGICGTVVVKRGNYMPSPDSPQPNPNGVPAEREVLIFPLLNMSQVDSEDNEFINSVRDAKPVKTVKSGKNGAFCVSLPVGQYSVIVREPKGLYANLFDSKNNIFPVSVGKGKKVKITVEITHQAVF